MLNLTENQRVAAKGLITENIKTVNAATGKETAKVINCVSLIKGGELLNLVVFSNSAMASFKLDISSCVNSSSLKEGMNIIPFENWRAVAAGAALENLIDPSLKLIANDQDFSNNKIKMLKELLQTQAIAGINNLDFALFGKAVSFIKIDNKHAAEISVVSSDKKLVLSNKTNASECCLVGDNEKTTSSYTAGFMPRLFEKVLTLDKETTINFEFVECFSKPLMRISSDNNSIVFVIAPYNIS